MTATRRTATVGGGGVTVAFVGPDGAGKSTVTAGLAEAGLPRPVKVIYMGVNLAASSLMLPTTRLLLAAKRARGGRPDLVATTRRDGEQAPPAGTATVPRARSRAGTAVRDGVRLGVWITEEWLRQLVATAYSLRGYIVVFDRHFLADYYHADVQNAQTGRSRLRRFHGWMLRRGYPKPDLMIMLDVPAERMHARKPETTVPWLEQRRLQYLELADVVPQFVVLDGDRPLEVVVSEAADLIRRTAEARA
jgi:thymidylate kinase